MVGIADGSEKNDKPVIIVENKLFSNQSRPHQT